VKKNKIITILFIAFFVRFALLIYQYNIGNLPQAGADSVRFERIAYQISNGYSNQVFFDVISNGAHLHSYIGSLIYDVFGREPMVWSFFFILLGLGTIYNIHRTVLLTTNNYKFANKAAWIACLFPNMAIFSVILLREVYIAFFISFAAYYFAKYLKNKNSSSIVKAVVFSIIGALFHPAIFSFVIGMVIYVIFFNKKANVISKVLTISVCVGMLYFVNSIGIGLDKFGGSFESAVDTAMDGGIGINEDAGANYSSWLIPKGNITDFLLLPVRMIAFLFAPLIPFFVRSGSHLIGLFDALIYFLIFYNIYINRNFHKKNIYSKAFLTIIFTITLAFSFGAFNFGTNIRHRAKVLPIILLVPLLSKKDVRKINPKTQTIKF